MEKLKLIRGLCFFMPPLLSQKFRSLLIPTEKNLEKGEFKRKAFFGGKYIGNFQDFHSLRFYIHGYFEWRNIIIAYKIQKIKAGDIVEVGANVGTETVSLAKISGNNYVHAFEPVQENFNYLKTIQKVNCYDNLILYQNLVSDKSGTASFVQPDPLNSGSGHITEIENKKTKKYEVVTLDERLSLIKSCSLIMIDVEGFELKVIRGGRDLIIRFKPYLIIEVNPIFLKERVNTNVSILYNEIWEMGYECFYIEKTKLIRIEIKAYQEKPNKNWLCIPRDELMHRNWLSRSIGMNGLNPIINYKIF